jgi:hypothetical protein
MGIKLVCIDVDGTLVGTSGQVVDRVWRSIDSARAAGLRVALCSGRPAFGITREYADRVAANGWHVFQNGASILRPSTGESFSTPLAPDVVRALRARSARTGRILELYTDSAYAVESMHDRARRHAALLGLPFAPRPFDSLTGPIVRAEWLAPLGTLDAILREPHEGFRMSPSTSPIMADTGFVNLTAPGVDKASAVRTLARIHGCALSEVMFVGDGLNDVEAMRIVGWPVAMANADPAVRAVARRHVGHVDEGGLAEALASTPNAA